MQIRKLIVAAGMSLIFLSTYSAAKSEDAEAFLWKIQKVLASKKYVDLTHEFAPGIPRWPGFPEEARKTIYWYDKRPDTLGAGFFSELFTHVGQWGTHVDPPAHFIKGLRTVDQIDPKEMILPMVIVDVHEEAAKNPDYTLSLERVKKWEKDHGQIPAGAFVAMRTDWSKRWPDAARMVMYFYSILSGKSGARWWNQATRTICFLMKPSRFFEAFTIWPEITRRFTFTSTSERVFAHSSRDDIYPRLPGVRRRSS